VRYDPTVDGQKLGQGIATDAKLYNLANDIGETNNLIDQEPVKAKALQEAWNNWNASNIPARWSKNRARLKAKGHKRQRAASRHSADASLGGN
jgi:hypothetical protein